MKTSILESMTEDAFNQFTRYGSGVHNIEIGMGLSNDEKRRIEESLKEIESSEDFYVHPDQARLYLEQGFHFDLSKVKRLYPKRSAMEQVFRNMPAGFLITAGMLSRHLKDEYKIDFPTKLRGIPDSATIPVNAVVYTMEPGSSEEIDHLNGFSWVMNLEVHLLDKFTWVSVNATVERKV